MTKKKKPSAADDLFESLLEDVKQGSENLSGNHFPDEENIFDIPDLDNEKLDLPSINVAYQSKDEVYKAAPEPAALSLSMSQASQSDETFALNQVPANPSMTLKRNEPPPFTAEPSIQPTDSERTIAVTAFAQKKKAFPEEKVIVGSFKAPSTKNQQVYTSVDASLAQAESLKLAQQRILQLEKEVDRLRQENDDLATAAEIIKFRADELENKLVTSEQEKNEVHEQAHSEIMILKGNLQHRDSELAKARIKTEELETRLKSDFKKIRSKERELENRLELMRAEKQALIRAKDDHLLELQRKMDQMKAELDNYRVKISELNKSMDFQNEQIKRTVRTLRLALTNLDAKGESIVSIKKAE